MPLRRPLLALALAAAALSSPLRAGENVWTPLGPEGGNVWQVTPDPGAPGTLYAAADGGVFKSTDSGTTWALSSRGLSDLSVSTLVVDPHHPERLFAASPVANEIFRSTDAGATWQAPDSILDGGIASLAFDPQSPATLYAGSFYSGLFRSTDGGSSWQPRSPDLLLLYALVADPLHPGTLYAGSGSSVTFAKSTDGGATWINRSSGLPRLRSGRGAIQIALDPEAPEILYASIATDYGRPAQTFRSPDGGSHWQLAGPGGLPLATGPGGAVYAGAARSLDHGRTWKRVTPAPSGPDLTLNPGGAVRLSVAPTSPTTVYSASPAGAFKSTDGALTWQRIVHGLNGTSITAVAVRPTGQPLVYAGVAGLGIVRSRPSGHGWVPVGSNLLQPPQQFLFDSKDPALLSAKDRGDVIRSTDDGQNWQFLNLPATPKNCRTFGIQAFDVAPTAPGKSSGALYAAVDVSGDRACKGYCNAYKSLDRGNTWSCLQQLAAPDLRRFLVSPSSPAVVYASESQHLWKSIDAGATWTRIDRNLQRLAVGWDVVGVDPTNAQIVYVFSNAGMLKSTDGGLTWASANQGLPAVYPPPVLVIDPATPTTLWFGLPYKGVYRSVDGGHSWHAMNGGLRGFSGSLALDPDHPETVYASTPSDGVYTLTVVP